MIDSKGRVVNIAWSFAEQQYLTAAMVSGRTSDLQDLADYIGRSLSAVMAMAWRRKRDSANFEVLRRRFKAINRTDFTNRVIDLFLADQSELKHTIQELSELSTIPIPRLRERAQAAGIKLRDEEVTEEANAVLAHAAACRIMTGKGGPKFAIAQNVRKATRGDIFPASNRRTNDRF
jgi:hypothetical protein